MKASVRVHVARMSPFCRHETLEKPPDSGIEGFQLRENSAIVSAKILKAQSCLESSPTGFCGSVVGVGSS